MRMMRRSVGLSASVSTTFRHFTAIASPHRRPIHAPRATGDYFATCHPGLEEVVAHELSSPEIRARDVRPGKAGVHFSGDAATLYRSNLWLRAAIRVLELLTEVELDPRQAAGESLYGAFREGADWPALLLPGKTFSVEARIWGNTAFTNSNLVQVRARDAICDAIRDIRGTRPSPPEQGMSADLPLFATAFQDRLSIYRDASGSSLHRRGYRQAMHKASLNEAAAAGCLYLAGWHQEVAAAQSAQRPVALADPMCGSGTFLIEAALMASNIAPGLFRQRWPFMNWPDSDRDAWRGAVEEAKAAQKTPENVDLWGNDRHGGALSLAMRDAEAAGVKGLIRLHHGECSMWKLPRKPSLVVTNPPWGQRLMGDDDGGRDQGPVPDELAESWRNLSSFLKQEAGGAEAFILSGSTQATQSLKLRASKRIPLTVGGVDCRLLQYSIRGRVEA